MSPTTMMVPPAGEFPNSPVLPVLLYRDAFSAAAGGAAAIERRFTDNGWGGTWCDGLYAFHHYHSRGHEALGVCKGWVRVQLGGEAGEIVRLAAGDAAVLPAGVAHKKIEASDDFSIVGAYPPGQWPDLNTGQPGEREAAEPVIAALAAPATDPVEGADGPLPKIYAAAADARR
jgi:uncharacterized protein YjlB